MLLIGIMMSADVRQLPKSASFSVRKTVLTEFTMAFLRFPSAQLVYLDLNTKECTSTKYETHFYLLNNNNVQYISITREFISTKFNTKIPIQNTAILFISMVHTPITILTLNQKI